jgi:DNA-binding LacI/PurR family transcriptional regulator
LGGEVSTIRDVAASAGVSLGTVSKFINGGNVKDANRKKIETAIKELNFRQNHIAKGLRNAQTFTVAVLVPMISSSFASVIISAIEKYLLPLGYCVIVSECHDDEEIEIQKINFMARRMVDGIIILPFSENGKQIELLETCNIPFVLIDQIIPKYETDSVILDNTNAIYMPTKKLIELGHTRIALVTGRPELFTSQKRIEGYRVALNEYNIPFSPELLINGNYTLETAFKSTQTLLEDSTLLPTAIIASNYEMTLGILLALNQLHVRIPEDISVFGFDNLPLSKVIDPPMSVVTQPMEEMGYTAASLLYKRIKGDFDSFPETVSHKASILVRDSIRQL